MTTIAGDAPRVRDGELPLAEHLRELRTRLIRALLGIGAGTGLAWFLYEPIIDVLIRPLCQSGARDLSGSGCGPLVVTEILGPLSLQLKVSLLAGILLSSPVWLYQLWVFVAPGLHRREKRWTYAFVASGVPLFLGGAATAYWLLPKAISVLLGFTPGEIENLIPIDTYLSFLLRMLVVFGLSFELPLILVVANLAGVLSGRRIASWWRGMVFAIVGFAAVATPTGDPLTMSALAAPLCLLYGGATAIALLIDRVRARRAVGDDDR